MKSQSPKRIDAIHRWGRFYRARLEQELNQRNERLSEGLHELWDDENMLDSSHALQRALQDVVDP